MTSPGIPTTVWFGVIFSQIGLVGFGVVRWVAEGMWTRKALTYLIGSIVLAAVILTGAYVYDARATSAPAVWLEWSITIVGIAAGFAMVVLAAASASKRVAALHSEGLRAEIAALRSDHAQKPEPDAAELIQWSGDVFKKNSAEWILEHAAPAHATLNMPDVVVVCKIAAYWRHQFDLNLGPGTQRILNRKSNITIGILVCRPATMTEHAVVTLKPYDPTTSQDIDNQIAALQETFATFFRTAPHLRERVIIRYLDAGVVDSMCAYDPGLPQSAVVTLDINKGWQEDGFPILHVEKTGKQCALYDVLIRRVAHLWSLGKSKHVTGTSPAATPSGAHPPASPRGALRTAFEDGEKAALDKYGITKPDKP